MTLLTTMLIERLSASNIEEISAMKNIIDFSPHSLSSLSQSLSLSLSTLSVGPRIRRLSPFREVRPHLQKKVKEKKYLDVTLNYIRFWGSFNGAIRSVGYLFVAITRLALNQIRDKRKLGNIIAAQEIWVQSLFESY